MKLWNACLVLTTAAQFSHAQLFMTIAVAELAEIGITDLAIYMEWFAARRAPAAVRWVSFIFEDEQVFLRGEEAIAVTEDALVEHTAPTTFSTRVVFRPRRAVDSALRRSITYEGRTVSEARVFLDTDTQRGFGLLDGIARTEARTTAGVPLSTGFVETMTQSGQVVHFPTGAGG